MRCEPRAGGCRARSRLRARRSHSAARPVGERARSATSAPPAAAGAGPRAPQLVLGAGEGDVEEPALLGQRVGCRGIGDGHHAVLEARRRPPPATPAPWRGGTWTARPRRRRRAPWRRRPPATTHSRNSPTVASGDSRACSSARRARATGNPTGDDRRRSPGAPCPSGAEARVSRADHELGQGAAQMARLGHPTELGQSGASIGRLLGASGRSGRGSRRAVRARATGRGGSWSGPTRPGATRDARAGGRGAASAPAPRPPRRRRRNPRPRGRGRRGATLGRDRPRARRCAAPDHLGRGAVVVVEAQDGGAGEELGERGRGGWGRPRSTRRWPVGGRPRRRGRARRRATP